MKCPHCLENFFENWGEYDFLKDVDGHWKIRFCTCPSCKRAIIELGTKEYPTWPYIFNQMIRPRSISRVPLPSDVPEKFAKDYREACLVLADSAKASAALSRRCLQLLLKEVAETKRKDLSEQIQEILDSKLLPGYLSENLDAVRNIGNFAAHPIKSKSTGEIVEVELGEAEWNLDVLESLFDFYFVQPEILKKKRSALDQKLIDAGKPAMKK